MRATLSLFSCTININYYSRLCVQESNLVPPNLLTFPGFVRVVVLLGVFYQVRLKQISGIRNSFSSANMSDVSQIFTMSQ